MRLGHRHPVVQRQVEERGRRLPGGIDDIVGYAVADDLEETDLAAHRVQLGGDGVPGDRRRR